MLLFRIQGLLGNGAMQCKGRVWRIVISKLASTDKAAGTCQDSIIFYEYNCMNCINTILPELVGSTKFILLKPVKMDNPVMADRQIHIAVCHPDTPRPCRGYTSGFLFTSNGFQDICNVHMHDTGSQVSRARSALTADRSTSACRTFLSHSESQAQLQSMIPRFPTFWRSAWR